MKNTIAGSSAVALCLLIFLFGAWSADGATIVDFDFSGVAGNVSHNKATFEVTAVNELHPNVELVQGVNIFSPSVLTFTTSGGQSAYDINLNNWGTGSTLGAAIDGNRFVSYTIAPEAGHVLNLNAASLTFDVWRNGAHAPQDYYLLVNSGGGAFTTSHLVGTLTVTDSGIANTHTVTATLPGAGYGALVGPVEVRLYGQNSVQSSGNSHLSAATMAGGEVLVPILATDFGGRAISGPTASGLNWASNGVADPGALTASHNLFDTADAQDKFAVARNIGNAGPWTVDVPLAVLDKPIDLSEIAMDVYIFNNSGVLQDQNRDVDITVRLLDDGMNELWSGSVLDVYPDSGSISPPQPRSIALDLSGTDRLLANTDYTLRIEAWSSLWPSGGNNAGIDNLFLAGHVVPEPGTWMLLLSALACGLLVRRRR